MNKTFLQAKSFTKNFNSFLRKFVGNIGLYWDFGFSKELNKHKK